MPKEVFVRLDDDLHAQVKADAEAEGRSLSNFVGRIVQAHYNKPIKDQKRGRAKRPPKFAKGDVAVILSNELPSGKITVEVLAVEGVWAMVKSMSGARAVPFVERISTLAHIDQEAQ